MGDPTLPFNSRIRSELMARLVYGVFEGCQALGITDPALLLHNLYTVLGLYSLIAIPAVYHLAEGRLGRPAARTAAWLMAVEAALPRLSTRALISMASIPPLVWGLVFADRVHRHAPATSGVPAGWAFGAGLLITLGALFRFQLGIVYLTVGVLLVVAWARARGWGAAGPLAGAYAAAGLLGVGAQMALDWHAFGSPIPAPWFYIQYNLTGSSKFGTAPWFSYFGMFLLLTLPPVTLAVAPGLWRAARRHVVVSVPFVVFFVLHSAVPHKEERFLFPLIPLFLVLLGAALVDAWHRPGWRRNLVYTYAVLNTILLVPATLSDAHRNITTPMLEARRSGKFSTFYGVGRMLLPVFYLADELEGQRVPDVNTLLQRWEETPPTGWVRILFNRRQKEDTWAALRARATVCDTPFLSHGDLVDQVLVWVNPVGNRRRRGPKEVIDCRFEQPAAQNSPLQEASSPRVPPERPL